MNGRMSHIINASPTTIQNLLRQALYWNYEFYRARGEGAFRNNEEIVEKHVSE